MDSKYRLGLVASLVLNVILGVWLIVSYQSQGEPSQVVAQATGLVPAATDTPVIIVVTATPAEDMSSPTPPPLPPPATPTPTPEAPADTPVPTVAPTEAPEATATPIPEATPTPEAPAASPPPPTAVPGPDWLRYANLFRVEANLPQLTENPTWSEGARLHSIFMVKSDQLWHREDPGSAWFTQAGSDAGENGNISASDWIGEPETTWAVDYWISAPFHALPFLDPELHAVGFGEYREEVGTFVVAATMDIKRGQGDLADVVYPLHFPRDGGQTWVLKHGLPEFPNPLTSCPGYQRPVGPPIILQMGPGDRTPAVGTHSFRAGDQELEHCIFDETSFVNPDYQDTGRRLLGERDAIVLMPRRPLEVGQTYTVEIVVDGEPVIWSFTAVSPPQ